MAASALHGVRVAILATDGFEQSELIEPRKALDAEGAVTQIISPQIGMIRGWATKDWGEKIAVDVELDQAAPDEYDALLLPGGVFNPDALRLNPKAVTFVAAFFDAGKPVAAICHGPWTVIETGAARGRKLTSWPSLKTDLTNAGATWLDKDVVVDQGLVTSRKPEDIPAFNEEMIKLFAKSRAGSSKPALYAVRS